MSSYLRDELAHQPPWYVTLWRKTWTRVLKWVGVISLFGCLPQNSRMVHVVRVLHAEDGCFALYDDGTRDFLRRNCVLQPGDSVRLP